MLTIKRLDHVQICIPAGKEIEAREFYGDFIGLKEIPKPESLISNGGLWYEIGDIELHIGVEERGLEKSKRHSAFEVEDVVNCQRMLEEKGISTQDEKPIPRVKRFSFYDPFGNRIEFLEREKVQKSPLQNEKIAITEQFSRSANSYVTSTIHAKGKDLKKLVEISEVKSTDYILDVATGGGHVANALASLAASVVAFDLTEEMLKVARTFITGNGNENVEFRQGDAESMPFRDEQFEIVTCRIAPHHFPNIVQFISEAFRVLKKGGKLLLVDNVVPEDDACDHFYNEVEKRRDRSHFRAWKKSEWLQMLEQQGFEVEEWYRFEKTFQFDDWCKRMNVTDDERIDLSLYMINTSERIKHKFNIQLEDSLITSFQGESILLKATKK